MEYNQLKLQILSLFENAPASLDSSAVMRGIKEQRGLILTDKAIAMALMRYWRQGLLERSRTSRRFAYTLTEKGVARKNWLLKKT
jgi:DNA-binding transcriptional regulator PaaX